MSRLRSFSCIIPSLLDNRINPHLPNGLSEPYQLDESIFYLRGVWCTFFIFIIFLIEIPVSKPCRPWSDAAFCGIWSGSALFVYVPKNGTPDLYGLTRKNNVIDTSNLGITKSDCDILSFSWYIAHQYYFGRGWWQSTVTSQKSGNLLLTVVCH